MSEQSVSMIIEKSVDEILRVEGRLGDTELYGTKRSPSEETMDNIALVNSTALLREVYSEERRLVKDLLKSGIENIMKNESIDITGLNIEIEERDIDSFFDILSEEH